MELRKIVVGMDEDPESVMALEEIIPVARKYGAEVILAHVGNVYDYPSTSMIAPEAIAHYQSLLAKRQKNVREKLAEIRERHSGQGVEISVSMLDGYPSVSIPDIEDELEADLVVCWLPRAHRAPSLVVRKRLGADRSSQPPPRVGRAKREIS